MGCKQNSANITFTLAAGSTASPFAGQVNISQRLCSPACGTSTPIFNPTFSLVGYSEVGTGLYVATIRVEGVISYEGPGGCGERALGVRQTFTIPFASAAEPTSVTIATSGATVNTISTVACQSCSRDFVSETPITLTVA